MLDETTLTEGLERIFRREPTADEIAQAQTFDNFDAAYQDAANSAGADSARTVITFYQVFLGRLPDAQLDSGDGVIGGLEFWVGILDAGAGVGPLAQFFVDSPEFEALYSLDNFGSVEAVVREFYKNNLGFDPLTEVNPATGQTDVDGLTFWTNVTNGRIAAMVADGVPQEEAELEAIKQLGIDFTSASQTQTDFGPLLTTTLINAGFDQADFPTPADVDVPEGEVPVGVSSLFDVQGEFRPVVTNPVNGSDVQFELRLDTVDGAEGVSSPLNVIGDPDGPDTLILVGNASVRIDTTDQLEQLEGIDVDGSADGTLDFDEVQDGITFFEQDAAFRESVAVQNIDIFIGHPTTDEGLLNPLIAGASYSGNLYYDGTGFGGDGRTTNGNIVLGGWGEDTIFTGIGNDFVSAHSQDDIIKTGRNADFIVQELTRLDERFTGSDGEVDGGESFDTNPDQDTDWVLLEASDDEEIVRVNLSDESGDEDNGSLNTRLENDGNTITNIENINASGNFFKILDVGTEDIITPAAPLAFVGAGQFEDPITGDNTVDTFYQGLLTFSFVQAGGNQLTVTNSDINTFDVNDIDPDVLATIGTLTYDANGDGVVDDDETIDISDDGDVGVDGFDEMFILTYSLFDQSATGGDITVRPSTDQLEPDIAAIVPESQNGPIIVVEDADLDRGFEDVIRTQTPTPIDGLETESRGGVPGTTLITPGVDLIPDLFFGDNRDFSEEAVEFRVPNLSPGVTAQLVVRGSSDENRIIGGYDNDEIEGLSGDDRLQGSDIEFLLTHRNNANLFDLSTGNITANAQDGVADGGRDTLYGGEGDDQLHWDAAGGDFYGSAKGVAAGAEDIKGDQTDTSSDDFGDDTLLVTAFSIGRLPEQGQAGETTDGSEDRFIGVDGAGNVAGRDVSEDSNPFNDYLGLGEEDAEEAAADEVTQDGVLRFDLAVGWGQDYQGNGPDGGFDGSNVITGTTLDADLSGADRPNTADQTLYNAGFAPTTIANIENVDGSGYLSDFDITNSNDPELVFEDLQNYRATNLNMDIRGVDTDFSTAFPGEDFDESRIIASNVNDLDFSLKQIFADFNVFTVGAGGTPHAALVASFSNDGGEGFARTDGDFNPAPEGTAASAFPAQYVLPSEIQPEFEDADVKTPSENILFGGLGDDTIEGRGGDDWVAGFQGDDTFIVSLNDGDNVSGGGGSDTLNGGSGDDVNGQYENGFSDQLSEDGTNLFGDNVDIIARLSDRVDVDGNEGSDGFADIVDGRAVVERDFRPGSTVTTQLTTIQLDPTGIYNFGPNAALPTNVVPSNDAQIPTGSRDDWSNIDQIVLLTENADGILIPLGPTIDTTAAVDAVQTANIVQAELDSLFPGVFTVSAGPSAVSIPGTPQFDDTNEEFDPGVNDVVNIQFNVDNAQGVVSFTSTEGEEFEDGGIEVQTLETVPDVDFDPEDDDLIFKSYQNRLDDESTPDQQASLGIEAYAEDLVYGVEDGTTKLVEDQKYNIYVDDLKDGDLFQLTLNGRTYELTVGINEVTGEDISGETTTDFLVRFGQYVADEIAMDPHSLDGGLVVMPFDPTGNGEVDITGMDVNANGINDDDSNPNSHGLMIFEANKGVDAAEHVYYQFPKVEISNLSGGDAPSVVVKDVSDTAVVLYDYDFRDQEGADQTDGLNRGVDHRTNRGPLDEDRFITFEDTTGLNRAILQNADEAGEEVEGLHVITFAEETDAGDFEEIELGGDLQFEDEIDLEAAIATGDDAYLGETDFSTPSFSVGNGKGQIGQPVGENEGYDALGGDDQLIGGIGVDTFRGYTGDDRIIASQNSNLTNAELADGGVNLVVDGDGRILFDASEDNGLEQDPTAGEILVFKDTLIWREGGDEEATDIFRNGTAFAVTVTAVAEDYSVDGIWAADEGNNGSTEHTGAFENIEVGRTFSDVADDILAFGSNITGVIYDNEGGNAGIGSGADMGWLRVTDEERSTQEIESVFGMTMVQMMGFETVIGSSGDDELYGGSQAESLEGGDGDDIVSGGLKDDTLLGGNGMDTLAGGSGDDSLLGGSGMDQLFGGEGDDFLDGGDDYDALSPGAGADTVLGGDGDDVFFIVADGDADSIDGGTGETYIHYDDNGVVDSDADTLNGGTGADDTILNITDFDKSNPVTISFLADDEDGDNESVEIALISVDSAGLVVYKATETINLGSVSDMTDNTEIAIAVGDALGTRGYDVDVNGGSVTINDVPGGLGGSVFINEIEFSDAGGDVGDDDNDLGAVTNQGSGLTVDLTDAVGNADELAFNGAAQVGITSETIGSVFYGVPTNQGGFPGLIDPTTGSYNFSNVGFFQEVLDTEGGSTETFMVTEAETNSTSDGLETGSLFLGGAGNDNLSDNSDGFDLVMDGGLGDDSLSGLAGQDTLLGGGGNDNLDGGEDDDMLFGQDGDDDISGGAGFDMIFGGDGDDVANGGEGNDMIVGEDGDDVVSGADGEDIISGNDGDDELNGGLGADSLVGGDGDDVMNGGDIVPGSGDDNGVFDDTLEGGVGNDVLNGGEGDDILEGGLDADTLTGGDDADHFVYDLGVRLDVDGSAGRNDDSRPTEDGSDLITDFDPLDGQGNIQDRLEINNPPSTGIFLGEATTGADPWTLPVDTSFASLGLAGFIGNNGIMEVVHVRNGDNGAFIADVDDNGVFTQGDLFVRTITQNGEPVDADNVKIGAYVVSTAAGFNTATATNTVDGFGSPQATTGEGDTIVIPDPDHVEGSSLFGNGGTDQIVLDADGEVYDLTTNDDNQLAPGGPNEPVAVVFNGLADIILGNGTDLRVDDTLLSQVDSISAPLGGDSVLFAENTNFTNETLSGIDEIVFAGASGSGSQQIVVTEAQLGDTTADQASSGLELITFRTTSDSDTLSVDGNFDTTNGPVSLGNLGSGPGTDTLTATGNLIVNRMESSNIALSANGQIITEQNFVAGSWNNVTTSTISSGGSSVDIDNTGEPSRTLNGDGGINNLTAGSNGDTLNGEGGSDDLLGGTGNDNLNGGTGNDSLFGGAGNDDLDGGAGDDFLDTGFGNDTLTGGDDQDILNVGGSGNHVLTGGTSPDQHRDAFNFTSVDGVSQITDFETSGTLDVPQGPEGDFINVDTTSLPTLDGTDNFGSSASVLFANVSGADNFNMNFANVGAEVVLLTGAVLTGNLATSVDADDIDGTNLVSAINSGGGNGFLVGDAEQYLFGIQDSGGNVALYLADENGAGADDNLDDASEFELFAVLQGVDILDLNEDHFRNDADPADGFLV